MFVMLYLSNLKSNAIGVDGISAQMLKLCSPFIDRYILHIINCCFEQNYYPKRWKVAIAKPLPKNSNTETFADLRLISILPAMSKIIERIM